MNSTVISLVSLVSALPTGISVKADSQYLDLNSAAPAAIQAPLLNISSRLIYLSRLIQADKRIEVSSMITAPDNSLEVSFGQFPHERLRITMSVFHYLASNTHDWQQGFVPNFHSQMSVLEVAGASVSVLDEEDIFFWGPLMHDTPWSVTARADLVGTLFSDLDSDEPVFILTNLPDGVTEAYITRVQHVVVYADGTIFKGPVQNY